jgi:hypothetical protein
MRNRPTAGRRGPKTASSARNAPASSKADGELADSMASLTIDIASLTDDIPIANRRKTPKQPFRLFDLPSELRLKIYDFHFANIESVLDLDHDNMRIHKKLAILRISRQVYQEASHAFYSIRSVRLFPINGKFFRSKKPLLARMSANQRGILSTLQLRLGPGWNRPPRGWVVNDALGLKDCTAVRRIKVFIDCDPSGEMFKGWRQSDGFYEGFSRDLLDAVLDAMPWCEVIEFDANPSVRKNGAMMTALLEVARERSRKIAWGPEKGWTDSDEVIAPEPIPNHAPIGRRPSHMMDGRLILAPAGHKTQGHGIMVAA